MQRRKSNGFTMVELVATIVILSILVIMFIIVFKKGIEVSDGRTCVEWEDAKVTDCWSYGMGTSCESYVEKRCVRYDD